MYQLYKLVDHNDENLLSGERKFFPANHAERTYSKFLPLVLTIYEILREIDYRYKLKETFNTSWDDWKAYLTKCGYSFGDMGFMANPGIFHRLSFNFWCREFQGQPEGLSAMYNWFKACFGIYGNEQYCIIESIRDVTYDWMKMKSCCIALHEEPQVSSFPELPPGRESKWSEESVNGLRTKIEEMQMNIAKDKQRKDQVLEVMKQENEKKEIFENRP